MTDPKAIVNNPFIELGERPDKKYSGEYTIQNKYLTVRDGVKIAATICIPKEVGLEDKLPTILVQTRYWRARELRIPFRWILNEVITSYPNQEIATSRGYIYIESDVRGTGASFGTREIPFSDAEVKDGYDIVEWIIAQPWSDGHVVSQGISYPGITAELLASNNHPAIKAVIPGHVMWDGYTDVAFPGGCYDQGFMQMWSFLGRNLDLNNPKVFRQLMPLIWLLVKSVKPVDDDDNMTLLKEAIELHKANRYVHESAFNMNYSNDVLPDGTTFKASSIYGRKEEIQLSKVPLLIWCSWYDSGYCDAVIQNFLNLNNPMIAILGDWNHGAVYPANQFFPERTNVTPQIGDRINAWINFFDQCIFGEGISSKTLYYYTLVEEKWKKTNIWPPEGQTLRKWYFSDNFSLSELKPETSVGEDDYRINFRATTGRFNRWYTLLGQPVSYANRSKIDEKLLCYTSPPFKEDLEITGQAIINLYLKSTHEDGSLFIYFEDIDEKGEVTYITDGEFRVIHRKISTEQAPYKISIPYHSYKKEDSAPLIPGQITEIQFELHPISVLILKNHRIRIAIAGADKDTFIRYPEEGRPTITISRNRDYASYIKFPTIERNLA